MIEAYCNTCHETFNPHLPEDRLPHLDRLLGGEAVEHYSQKNDGEVCHGVGIITGEWR